MNNASKDRRIKILRIALVIFFVGFTVLVAIFRDSISISTFRQLGYLGVFLMAWVGSTTVILPIPHLAFTFTMGSVLTPWFVGLCAGFGDSLGELWGYLVGYSVEDAARHWKIYPTIEGWMRRNGSLTVFLMGIVPMPLFDLAGIAGGATGFPVWKFYLSTWAAKTIKAIIFAWGGYYGIAWLAQVLGL